MPKLTETEVKEIRLLGFDLMNAKGIAEIAEEYGVSVSCVRRILKNKSWRNVSYGGKLTADGMLEKIEAEKQKCADALAKLEKREQMIRETASMFANEDFRFFQNVIGPRIFVGNSRSFGLKAFEEMLPIEDYVVIRMDLPSMKDAENFIYRGLIQETYSFIDIRDIEQGILHYYLHKSHLKTTTSQ